MNQEILDTIVQSAIVYTPFSVIINMLLAFVLGMIISYLYRMTHKGLSYSQSFVLTIIFITLITSSVIMVIGNNLARAFALVGALSIIRFRTVVKDTKDTSFVFLALAIGMASGTGSYFIAIYTTFFVCLIIWILHKFNYGILGGNEFILRFYSNRTVENEWQTLLKKMTQSMNLLHLEPTGDDTQIHFTYDISLKENHDAKDLISKLSNIEGVDEVVLVSSKSNIDY